MMRSKNGPKPARDAAKALHRQPAQVDGKDLDQHIADHEHRDREADHRQSHHEAVDPGAVFPCRDHAERHRDHDREDDGRQRDAEIEGSTRWPIICSTGTFEISDTPRSPCSSLPIQVKNWRVERLVQARAKCGCARAVRASHCRRPGSRRDRPASAAAAETRTAPPRPSREWRPARGEADIRASGASVRRPCESRDPYAGHSRWNAVADVRIGNAGRWLWVPAFAGTTNRDGGTLQKSIMILLSHSDAPKQVLANPVPSAILRAVAKASGAAAAHCGHPSRSRGCSDHVILTPASPAIPPSGGRVRRGCRLRYAR